MEKAKDFASLADLKKRRFDTRKQLEQELKKAGLAVSTPTYRPLETLAGQWIIEEIDPDASQEVETKEPPKAKPKPPAAKIVQLNTSKAARQPVATPAAAPEKKDPAPASPKKAAPAKPKSTGGKSSDPSSEDLPKGFEEWALAEAYSKSGVLRTDLNKKIGTQRRWSNYLTELGKKHGLKLSSTREGRFTRFFLKD